MINGTIRISSVRCNYMWEEREKKLIVLEWLDVSNFLRCFFFVKFE